MGPTGPRWSNVGHRNLAIWVCFITPCGCMLTIIGDKQQGDDQVNGLSVGPVSVVWTSIAINSGLPIPEGWFDITMLYYRYLETWRLNNRISFAGRTIFKTYTIAIWKQDICTVVFSCQVISSISIRMLRNTDDPGGWLISIIFFAHLNYKHWTEFQHYGNVRLLAKWCVYMMHIYLG